MGYSIPAAQLTGWVDKVKDLPVVKCQAWMEHQSIDIDLFLAETNYQSQLLTRRRYHQTEWFGAWFVSPEDLILLKLLAGRPKDPIDVGEVLFIQGDLDLQYLRHWAGVLEISAALEAALAARNEAK